MWNGVWRVKENQKECPVGTFSYSDMPNRITPFLSAESIPKEYWSPQWVRGRVHPGQRPALGNPVDLWLTLIHNGFSYIYIYIYIHIHVPI